MPISVISLLTTLLIKSVPFIINFMSMVIVTLISVIGTLIPICVSRAKNIPSHINLLIKFFNRTDLDNNKKLILAVILIGFTGILPFIVFSFIPATGVPIVGLLTSPIACLLSFLLICLAYELVIIPILSQSGHNFSDLKDEFAGMQEDYFTIKTKVGPKWDRLANKFKKLIDRYMNEIINAAKKLDISMEEFFEFVAYAIGPSIGHLCIYLGEQKEYRFTEKEIEIMTEKMKAWKKFSFATAASMGCGSSASLLTQTFFSEATLKATILAKLGFGSATILLPGSAFSLLTIGAPIAISVSSFIGSYKLLNKIEKNKASKFLADSIISAMVMIDGDGNKQELELLGKLISDPAINEKDRNRLINALKTKNISLNYIISHNLLHEKDKKKEQIKVRFFLSLALAIATADGPITDKERATVDKLKRIFKPEEDYTQEVELLLVTT